MSKFLTILAASTALAVVTVAAPTNADARWRGGGIAAGVIGGIAAGAIIAGAAANNGPYYYGGYDYAPGYAYGPGPGYGYAPGYAYDAPYGYYGYGGSVCDRKNFGYDRQLQGSC